MSGWDVVGDVITDGELRSPVDLDVLNDALVLPREELGQCVAVLVEMVVGVERRVRQLPVRDLDVLCVAHAILPPSLWRPATAGDHITRLRRRFQITQDSSGSGHVALEPGIERSGGLQAGDHPVLGPPGGEPGTGRPRPGHDDALVLEQLTTGVLLGVAPGCRLEGLVGLDVIAPLAAAWPRSTPAPNRTSRGPPPPGRGGAPRARACRGRCRRRGRPPKTRCSRRSGGRRR